MSKTHTKISLKEAVKHWEEKYGKLDSPQKIGDQLELKFNGWSPPIEKLDNSASTFTNCEFLSLSTNMLDRLTNLNGLKCLKVLSVGRNYLKSLAGVEACAETLEEIWASYNQIEKPTKGTLNCKKLRRLDLANNWIREWPEVTKLNELLELKELVLVGNPLNEQFLTSGKEFRDWQREVGSKITQLEKLDGYSIVTSSSDDLLEA